MTSIGKKIKDAGTRAAKEKILGSGKESRRTEGSESGGDKAMKTARKLLK